MVWWWKQCMSSDSFTALCRKSNKWNSRCSSQHFSGNPTREPLEEPTKVRQIIEDIQEVSADKIRALKNPRHLAGVHDLCLFLSAFSIQKPRSILKWVRTLRQWKKQWVQFHCSLFTREILRDRLCRLPWNGCRQSIVWRCYIYCGNNVKRQKCCRRNW